MLHTERRGKGPPVVLLHGFTQTSSSWDTVADALVANHAVITIDAPGHGESGAVRADLPGGAAMMVDAAAEPAAWIGYSMGGRFALHAALQRPLAFRRLVVVSATGGIDDPDLRESRRRDDEDLARKVEAEGVEAFVEWWLARPMFSRLPASAAGAAGRLTNTPAGLASSLRLAGTGTQQPLWADLGALDMPVLVVAGERDEAYATHAGRIVECVGPNAQLALVPGAGHACHLERPDEFLAIVKPFLDER